eukprot:2232488-Prymnesium_polylepis.1
MEAAHVESALAKQQIEMERGEASIPAAGPRTRPPAPPASPPTSTTCLTAHQHHLPHRPRCWRGWRGRP